MSHIIISVTDNDDGAVSVNSEVTVECSDHASLIVVELQKINLQFVQRLLDESIALSMEGQNATVRLKGH